MDADTLARAVEPFFSTKGVGQGTGLGLSMVHGLMEQLGGAMRLSSTPGQGTRVELWLPRTVELPAPPQERKSASSSGDGTVLLVDDEEAVRASTAELLFNLGYDVVEASSGEEALSLMTEGLRPTHIITDHLMHGMTGSELADAVLTRNPDQRIIIASGYADQEGLAARFRTLPKPFSRSDLLKSLSDTGGENEAADPGV
jgi:CheY-like chemotaxis protein